MLQMPYGQVDRLAKLIPNHPTDPWTLERALNGVSELAAEYKNDAEVRRLFDLAMKLEGLPRHASTHAAGVVIGDRPLDQLVPLYRDPRSDMPVTQFDMKYVEAAGLVKFDFLGLKTLSVLQKAVQMLAKRGVEVDLDRLAWDDPRGLRAAPARRDGRRVPARIGGHAPDAGGGEADQLRGHHRARLALPAGADGQYPDVRRPQERPRADRLPASLARGGAEGDLRHLRLPGAGDGGRQGARRLQPRRGRPAPPRDGQEDQGGDGRPARRLRRRLRAGQFDPEGQGERAVRLDRQVRRLRLQQEPRRRLRPDRLPDRLAEGAPSGRILRRLDVLRHRTRPTSSPSSSTTCGGWRSSACRPRSTPARPSSRSRTPAKGSPSATRSARSRASARRRWSSSSRSGARTAPFKSLEDFAERVDPRLLNRRQIESLAGGGAFDPLDSEPRRRLRRGRDHPRPCRERRRRARERAGRPVRRRRIERRADPDAGRRDLDPRPAHGGREGIVRLLFLGPSGRPLPPPRRGPWREELRRLWPRCRRRRTAAAPAR